MPSPEHCREHPDCSKKIIRTEVKVEKLEENENKIFQYLRDIADDITSLKVEVKEGLATLKGLIEREEEGRKFTSGVCLKLLKILGILAAGGGSVKIIEIIFQ